MPKLTTKPTPEYILALYDDTKKQYEASGIFAQWDEDEKYYELDFKALMQLPEEFAAEGIVLPTARDIVDTVVDHTDIYNVRVWANRKGTSAKSEEEQDLLRKFGLGVLYRNNIEASIAPTRVGAKHYWLHGLTIIKDVWDADRMFNPPTIKKGESVDDFATRVDTLRAYRRDSCPIVIQACHPKSIMLDPYYTGGTFVFETRKELCYNSKQDWPAWKNNGGKEDAQEVEHIEFWTSEWRAHFIERECVKLNHHDYGLIPYVPIDTGLGNMTDKNDMKKRYVGVLRYVRDVLVSESRDYSIGDIILKKQAWPWGTAEGDNAAAVTEIEQKFGTYTPLPPGVKLVDMVPKMPPDALLTWMSASGGILASHAAPNVTRGMGETGVRSGSDRQLLLSEASTRYLYANEAFRNGIAKVLSNCAYIMKNVVPGNLNVWARTPTDEFDIEINKDKMKEPFTFYVEFSPTSEEDEYRRHDDLERMYKSGIVTKKWVRKQMSNVDSKQMELEEDVELLMQSPMIQQLTQQYAGAKYNQGLMQRSAAENPVPAMAQPPGTQLGIQPGVQLGMAQPVVPEAMQPGQEPGRRMRPPIPNNAPIGSGQEMQNKMKAQRSQKPMTQQGQGGGGNRR
jgi:hypothetical protein